MSKVMMINLPIMPKEIKVFGFPSGSRKKQVYKYEYDESRGCPRRVPNGFIDLQDAIQSYADDVDFKAIGKMLVDTRENVVGHFNVDGEVFDMTGQPRNIHEFEALHNKLQSQFNELPSDLKNLFNNDFNDFKKSYSNGTLGSTIDTYYKSISQTDVNTSTVKDGE